MYLDGVVPLWEVHLLLLLLLGDKVGLVLGQASAHGTGLLWSEVERSVLLVLVEDLELRTLVDVDDSEDTGDRLADVVAVGSDISILSFRVLVLCFASMRRRTFCSTLTAHHRQSSVS